MKKLITVLFTCLILVGCAKTNTEINYVMPAVGENTVELDDANKAKLEALSEVFNFEKNDLQALDVDLNDISSNFVDKNGEQISLEGVTFVEIVATWCSFCQEQSKTYNSNIANKYKDYKFIQFFGEQEESIKDFDKINDYIDYYYSYQNLYFFLRHE